MFEHSVKVPRQYKVAANIFKTVSTEGGSVKTLLYDNKLKHFRTNVLYALITETIKHAADIDKIFASCGLLQNEPRLDPWLSKVLTAELLFGKKTFPGKSKPEQIIFSYKEQFEKYTTEHQDDLKTEVVRRPRYVRINTNLLTTSDAIGAFQDEGYRFIRCTSGSYDDYLKQIQGLSEYDFTQDYHVKTVFVFSAGTKLHEHNLYLENKIILQDKATTMAVHLLAPPNGSVVLDLCAAPGMKTTQAAAFMRNEGKIYAIERNEQRYQTLCDFVERTGSKCVQTFHKDALDIKRGDFDDVEYIILDPSCSGSGMELCVHNYIEDTRLAKLTSLQEKFLKHAMNAFPKAKRIVYSTCSLFPEENERVVVNTVKTSRAKWRVQDVKELLKGQWNSMGSGMYGSIGTRCMYARPGDDMTTGFFLAVLDRDPKDLEKSLNNERVNGKIKNKGDKHEKKDKREEETMDDDGQVVIEKAQKKKKRKDRDVSEIDAENDVNCIKENKEEPDFVVCENGKKKKHKKKRKEVDERTEVDETIENQEANVTEEFQISDEKLKKKKKKSKNKEATEIPEMDSEAKNENSEQLSRKKHKRDNAEDNLQELEQPVKKKKKHEKNTLQLIENEIDVVTETVKKKKKKRDKDLES